MFEDAGQRRFDVRQEGHENHHSDKEVIRDKGDPSKLFAFVEEHLIGGRKFISVEILTDAYGLYGKDWKCRYHVKGVLKTKYNQQIIATLNKPQVAVTNQAHNTGELLHQSSR